MLFKGGAILRGSGKLLGISDSNGYIEFEVEGTCFPSKRAQGIGTSAVYTFDNANNVGNKAFIDFDDGTGEHEYSFKSSGVLRRLSFRNLGSQTTPETIQSNLWDDAPVYFYQDLPEGVKNTVQELYPHRRKIRVRFENRGALSGFTVIHSLIFNQFPSNINLYNGLRTLSITRSDNITTMPLEMKSSFASSIILSNIGSKFSGLPTWITNSALLSTLNITNTFNLSGSAEDSGLVNIKNLNNLAVLNIGSCDINYQLPDELGELPMLNNLIIGGNTDPNLKMPSNLEDMTALLTLNISGNSLLPSEIQRIITDTPNLSNLDIGLNSSISSDLDISTDNNTIKTITIDRTDYAGAVPLFVNKLKALERLNLSANTTYSLLTSWGNFSGATNINRIDMQLLPNFTTGIPSWFSSLILLKTLDARATFQTEVRTDEFVDNLYAFVVGNASMVVANTAFRNMIINIYGSSTAQQTLAKRPTGTYQEPSGYVQGSNNGTPASQMEKIWVLVNQYGHTWTVKP